MVHTQFGKLIKRVRCDNDEEFTYNDMLKFYGEQGILLETTCPHTPQQNGVVKRKHRHIIETARALRFETKLPKIFWGECVLTATYIINRLPSTSIGNKIPYEILFNQKPDYDLMKTFGCLLYYSNNETKGDKFEERGRPGIFLGYPPGTKGYKIYDIQNKKITISRHVTFHENDFPFDKINSGQQDDNLFEPIIDEENPNKINFEPTDVGPIDQENALGPDQENPFVENSHEHEIHIDQENQSEHDQGPIFGRPEQATEAPLLDAFGPDQAPNHENISPEPDSHDSPIEETIENTPIREKRTKTQPNRFKDFVVHLPSSVDHARSAPTQASSTVHPLINFVSYNNFSNAHKAFLAAIDSIDEPKFFHRAMKNDKWKEAMQKEIRALEENGTLTLEKLPEGKRAIDSKWVYKVKYKPYGNVERYKARLVAKGFTQMEGVDYHDTFASVAKLVTVRTILAIAVKRNWFIHQLDVNNAFLHGDLNKEVYMKIPQGFSKEGETRVCRLKKSLYGLKQASRNWYIKFTNALLSLVGNNGTKIQDTKGKLDQRFSIKDLGNLKYFLGIEVARTTEGLILSQRKYVLDILEDSGLQGCRPSSFPFEQNLKLDKREDEPKVDAGQYRRLVGRLLYLQVTRPDIAYSVNILSQFFADLRKYDVFLSFRGEDTRYNFVDLHVALKQSGICVFKDDGELKIGKAISPELLKAIEESKFAVVVISRNYANSSWCLAELAKIMEWHNRNVLKVIPVFYHVNPSDIRGQKNEVAVFFQQHEVHFREEMDKVNEWRDALTAAANLSGKHISDAFKVDESTYIREIVEEILHDIQPCDVDGDLVGIDFHIDALISKLEMEEKDEVRMIGIYGMGGIGKTTIAKALFSKIKYMFESSSFLYDNRENSFCKRDICALQEKVLREILPINHNFSVQDPKNGANIIRARCMHKKVLIVLDDVDNGKQLEFLANAHDWFGPGSRIIITTRNEQLLSDVNEKYKPDCLLMHEALELFSRHAFKRNSPPEGYEELSLRAIQCAGYFPLAVKVLGSFFHGKKAFLWESYFNRLAKAQHADIFETLKLSFDGLEVFEKNLFLDIACFFKGKYLKDVTKVFESCGFDPQIGISFLIEKSLITLSNDELGMHDLIQEMGWQIDRESFPNSRLWKLEDIRDSLKDKQVINLSLILCVVLIVSKRGAVVDGPVTIVIPGNKIPCWFKEQPGYSVAVMMPPKRNIQIIGIAICGVFSGEWRGAHYNPVISVHFEKDGKSTIQMEEVDCIINNASAAAQNGNTWIGYRPCSSFRALQCDQDWSGGTLFILVASPGGAKAVTSAALLMYKLEEEEEDGESNQQIIRTCFGRPWVTQRDKKKMNALNYAFTSSIV
ncbi:uncharacterized protein LOC143538804 [Bidens hawaiensis]|uniref:uncharacterized protein LOC143538804 n=1 Tax=Bidens hawaiensis TaxID=980011 RepID=UPI00404B60E1